MPDDLTAVPTDLHWLTIADAARLIERRRLSPVELTDALIARVEALDPQLNAFLLPTPEKAREQAKAAEREIMAGNNYRGPLHGIPFGLKDIYATSARTWSRPKTRPPSPSFTRPAVCCWASSRPMNSRMAGRLSTCPGRRRATRGTVTTSPADHRAALGRRLPPAFFRVPLAPIPGARSVGPRRCAGLSG